MESSKPYASLCILSYERGNLLFKGLQSLRAHTTYPHERILHDDASVLADTRACIEMADVSYMILNKGKNRGIGQAMKACIGVSSGEYILKLDADLEYLPHWLETVVGIYETQKDVVMVGLFNYLNYAPHDTRFKILEERENCYIVEDFVNSGYLFNRHAWQCYGFGMGDDGLHQFVSKAAAENKHWTRSKLAIPKRDVVINHGFSGNSVYIQNGQVAKTYKYPKIYPKQL